MATTVVTFDWDTVSAITYSKVNQAIADTGASPASFEYKDEDGDETIKGDFGNWAVTTGGSEQRINMLLPLKNANFTPSGPTTPIADFNLQIEVEASFIPQPGTTSVDLGLQAGSESEHGIILISEVADLQKVGFSFLSAGRFLALFKDWLEQNIGQFNHVFASINLDVLIERDDPTMLNWIKPSWYSYAVAEPIENATNDNSLLAVLTLIDNKLPEAILTQKVSLHAIPEGKPAGFSLSPEIFLRKFLMPAAMDMFANVELSQYAEYLDLESSGEEFRSIETLTLKPLHLRVSDTVTQVKDFKVEPGDFTVRIVADEIIMDITNMSTIWSPGINLHFNYSARLNVGFDPETGHLDLTPVEQGISSMSVSTDKGLRDFNLALGIAGGVLSVLGAVGGVVAVVTETGEAVAATANQANSISQAARAAINTINSGNDVVTLGDRVLLFGKIAAISGLAGGALSSPAWVTTIVVSIAENQNVEAASISDLADLAVQHYAKWPETLGLFKMTDVKLSGALIFGLENVT